ncbi:hypothetical protein [Chondromyces crocatus]|uniref:Uncharacterized protein n=1 Tax=Chondromyces crocatus TaxID=52 RepID=A0A0K1EH49_CHOCO|nr:hypothetical protein [Chondromyces crocatus]AKT39923.1 uncharacterized protein CMC5_040740 [Chondromyces crocatus]
MTASADAVSSEAVLRAPRVLEPSRGLLEALTRCAAVRKELRELDGMRNSENAEEEVPLFGARSREPVVDLAALVLLEREMGCVLQDDLLVLLAVRDPVARTFTGLHDLASVGDAEDAGAYESETHACIAMAYSDPIAEMVDGAHGGAYVHLWVPRGSAPSATVVVSTGDPSEGTEMTVGEYLMQRLDEAVSAGWLGAYGEKRVALLRTPARLQGSAPAPVLQGKRMRVRHARFGEGTVVETNHDGEEVKAVVAFADGQRTLMMRFLTVQEADEAPV